MGQNLKFYDPDLVDVLFSLAPIDGFATDSLVSIEADEQDFTIVKGVKGDISRSKNLGVTFLVTIMLMSTSRSNAFLSAIRALDGASAGGAGVAPILIRDRNGTSLFESDKAWIEQAPTVTRGKEAAPQEWKIRVIDATLFEGGT